MHSFNKHRSHKQKRCWQLEIFFTLLGSSCVKALSKHAGEIDPWSQFHQHFKSVFCSFSLLSFFVSIFGRKLAKKAAYKMLVKLTTNYQFDQLISDLVLPERTIPNLNQCTTNCLGRSLRSPRSENQKRWINPDRCQFHQYFRSPFFIQKSFAHLFSNHSSAL